MSEGTVRGATSEHIFLPKQLPKKKKKRLYEQVFIYKRKMAPLKTNVQTKFS